MYKDLNYFSLVRSHFVIENKLIFFTFTKLITLLRYQMIKNIESLDKINFKDYLYSN